LKEKENLKEADRKKAKEREREGGAIEKDR
jgi:hypothetical protein